MRFGNLLPVAEIKFGSHSWDAFVNPGGVLVVGDVFELSSSVYYKSLQVIY